jgi:hypothetical protein
MCCSVLEYPTREDAEAAVKTLDGKELRGVTVRVTMGGGDVCISQTSLGIAEERAGRLQTRGQTP